MLISRVYQQFNLLLLSLGFFTRIPVFKWAKYSDEGMAKSRRYFALTGLLVGGMLASVLALANLWLPANVSIILVMGASILLTGALHEDGLADVADAFGGGRDKASKLTIMKDSRLGTYGTSALCLVLLLKFVALGELARQHNALVGLLVAYPLSRAWAMSHVASLPYVSASETSKSGPVASQMDSQDWLILAATASVPLWYLSGGKVLALLVVGWLVREYMHRLMRRHIQGFTGDTLGASQQIQELAVYLVLLASW